MTEAPSISRMTRWPGQCTQASARAPCLRNVRNSTRAVIACAAVVLLFGCGGGGGGVEGVGSSSSAKSAVEASDAKSQGALGKPAEDPSLCTVEIYGDSIMASNGTAVTPSATLQLFRPNLLVVADHAVGGMSLAELAASFPGLTRRAHYVIIENGVIDAWQGKNINTVISEYSAIVQRVRDEGRIPVLTGFSHQSLGGDLNYFNLRFRDFYDSVIQAVATNNGVAFADWGSVPFFGAWDLIDFVHPNKNYSDRLVFRLALTLDMLAPNCTEPLFSPG